MFILLVYIDPKFPLFITSKEKFWSKKTPPSLHEKKTWTSTWRWPPTPHPQAST